MTAAGLSERGADRRFLNVTGTFSFSVENSTYTRSSCAPRTSIFEISRQLEKLLADILHSVPQLPVGEFVGGEAVDDAIGVAELVVEADAGNLLAGQGVADIAHLLAHLVPDVGHPSGRRRVLQVHEDRGLACGRVALQIIQVRRLPGAFRSRNGP